MQLRAYTDGSNTYNGFEYSYGGYGWILMVVGNEEFLIEGGGSMSVNLKDPVTNNKAELLGVISVLEYVVENDIVCSSIEVFSDSQITVKCANGEWKPKKNHTLWARFFKVRNLLRKEGCSVTIKWIKGHAGHKYNEMADDLAGKYAQAVRQEKPFDTIPIG